MALGQATSLATTATSPTEADTACGKHAYLGTIETAEIDAGATWLRDAPLGLDVDEPFKEATNWILI
jgi:hypothetical protein